MALIGLHDLDNGSTDNWDKLFNAFFLFEKLVKYNIKKLIWINRIET